MKFVKAKDVPIGEVFGSLDGWNHGCHVSFYHVIKNPESASETRRHKIYALKLGERDTGSGNRPYAFDPDALVIA